MLFLFFIIPLIAAQQQTRSCGTMQSNFSTASDRIVGDESASDYPWPWQVYISVNGSFICGGTLIDIQHVVTGAHCIVGQSNDANDYLIHVGVHNRTSQGYYTGSVYSVSTIFIHDNYVSVHYGSDIALIRLSHAVGLSDTVNIACLPPGTDYYIPMNQSVVIKGFGLTQERGGLPYTLQQAVIQLISTCSNIYQNYMESSQICAGIQSGRRDKCQGDSGGSLVHNPKGTKQWVLIGITSYGNGCARFYYPGIYTRVSTYLSWIQQKMATNK